MQSWQKRGATLAFTAVAVVAFASTAEAQVASTTTVTATPSTAATGQSVELDAVVKCAGDPSGGLGMTFFDGANLLATVPVAANGTASFTTSFTTTGAHPITAAYNGNGNCDASNGTTTVEATTARIPPGMYIHNKVDIHDTYNIYYIYIRNTHNVHHIHRIHINGIHKIGKHGGGHRPWKSEWNRYRKSR